MTFSHWTMFDCEKLLHDINNLICGRHDDFAYMQCIHLYNVAFQLSLVCPFNTVTCN